MNIPKRPNFFSKSEPKSDVTPESKVEPLTTENEVVKEPTEPKKLDDVSSMEITYILFDLWRLAKERESNPTTNTKKTNPRQN